MAEYNLDKTMEVAVQRFAAQSPMVMALNSGSELVAPDLLQVVFMGQVIGVQYPSGTLVSETGEPIELKLTDHILVLHYLAHCQNIELSGSKISFKELPDGEIYIGPFTKRAINPILKVYGTRPHAFIKKLIDKGGVPESLGDASVTVRPFPKVEITYVLWEGDDEFPANATILFDATAKYVLPTEDYAYLASHIVYDNLR